MNQTQTFTVGGGQGANRESQLPKELYVLEKTLAQTGDLMSDLEQRLEVVINPEVPDPRTEPEKRPEEVLSTRAQDVRIHRYGLERINGQLMALLSRLEV